MIDNKGGNPYHDSEGKFTSKEGQGEKVKSPEIENAKKIIDDFFSRLKEKGFNLKEKEPTEKSSDLDIRIDEEVSEFKEARDRFGWLETDVDIAHEVADKLESEGLGDSRELFDKILNKMESEENKVDFKSEKQISPSSAISITLPDGGSDIAYVDNLGEKIVDFIKDDVELSDEAKEYIIENEKLPESLNPFTNKEIFLKEFEEWLKDDYYANHEDDSFDAWWSRFGIDREGD